MQGNLLLENKKFTSRELWDFETCDIGMRRWYFGPQPLALLFIVNRITNIGR